MKGRLPNRAVLGILLIYQFSICLAANSPDANDSGKYLDALREFANNLLKYGGDRTRFFFMKQTEVQRYDSS